LSIRAPHILLLLVVVALAFFLGRWSSGWEFTDILTDSNNTTSSLTHSSALEKIKKKGELDVVMVNGPTTYFEGAVGKEGFEYILMREFAEYLGVALKLHVVPTVNEALALSKKGVGDITSGALTQTPEREEKFVFGPSYFSVKEQLICHQRMIRNKTFPRTLSDLVGLKITVGDETSYVTTLEQVQKELPALYFKQDAEHSSEELLGLVDKGVIDCTLVDSNVFAVNNRYYPALRKALDLSKHKKLAWILRENSTELNATLNGWLNHIERSGEMDRLKDHYYSYTNSFNYLNLVTFHKRLKTRFPKYKETFIKAAEKYDLPWTMLAAQSYQESHWDRLAKSPTGVRGMMMLTLVTAKEMGIKHRLNATSSIYGGAKYFRQVYDRIAEDVKGIDRYKFAYAAYNIGMGHLIDARALARKQGKNPSSWKDLKTVLPLLSQKKYYRHLKHGYARGQEPVDYVDAIYEYHVILENEFPKDMKHEN